MAESEAYKRAFINSLTQSGVGFAKAEELAKDPESALSPLRGILGESARQAYHRALSDASKAEGNNFGTEHHDSQTESEANRREATDDWEKSLNVMGGDGGQFGFYGDGYNPDRSPETQTREAARNELRDKNEDSPEADDGADDTDENPPNTTKDPEDENGYEHLDQSAETKAREDEREGLRGDDEGDDEGNESPDTAPEKKTKAAGKLGEDGEALGELTKDAKLLEEGGEAAEALGGLAEAGGIAEALAAAWPVILAVLGVLVVLFMLIILFFVIFMMFPDKAAGTTPTNGKASVICLDPGHLGAPGDPSGAGGEAAINLRVADEVKDKLKADGYKVVMTRDGSSHVSLTDRAPKCVAAGAALMYAFHADGTARSKGYPYQIYMKPGRKESSTSKSYAVKIQAAVSAQVSGIAGFKNGGIEDETHTGVKDLAIFRGADSGSLPAVLTEMVQLKNGHSVLDDAGTRAKLVTGIVNGIEDVVPATTASDNGGGTVSGNSLGEKVVAAARAKIGKPYRWGAIGPNSFDCSGLAQWAYKQAGLRIVRTSRAQYSTYTHIKKGSEQPGDLVFFGSPIHHVGIVIGGGKMIEAPHTGAFVRISSYSRSDLVGFSRPK